MSKERLTVQLKCLNNLLDMAIGEEERMWLVKFRDQVEYQLKNYDTTED